MSGACVIKWLLVFSLVFLVACKSDSSIRDKAVKERNPDLCTEIESIYMRNNCYDNIAMIMNNIEICKRIENTEGDPGTSVQACISRIAGGLRDITLCKQIPLEAQPECIANIGIATNNVSLCPLSENKIFDNCIFVIAAKSKNATLCNKLSNTTRFTKEMCLRNAQS